ncbi:hypothetical protein CF319_g4799 [Tilletia indica]|nr:hypothetical protein CF319_g4799 [Tilletia indica]
MSQISTTTSSYFLSKFARQDFNPQAPEQGLVWSFFDKPTLIVKLFRTTTSPGPYHDALAKLGAARLGQPHPSSMRLEVEWQVENVGSSQTQGGQSPYSSICLQNLDFEAQAGMLTSALPRSDLPLKATYQDDMVGFRYMDATLQAGGPYRRFQLKFPNRADMFRFIGEIENVCPCAEATSAPIPPALAKQADTDAGISTMKKVTPAAVDRADTSPSRAHAPVVEATEPQARHEQPPRPSVDEEVRKKSCNSAPQDNTIIAPEVPGAEAPAKKSSTAEDARPKPKGKAKATKQTSAHPNVQDQPAQLSQVSLAADASKTKGPKAAAKPRTKAKPRAKQLTESSCQTDTVEAHPRPESAANRVQAAQQGAGTAGHNGNDNTCALGVKTSAATDPQRSHTAVERDPAHNLDLPPIEQARARLQLLSGDEILAAFQELMNSPWRDLAIQDLPTLFKE